MDTKQKSLLVLTVIALGFLGYQIFQLVSRDISETPVLAEKRSEQAQLGQANASPAPATAVEPVMAIQPPKLNIAQKVEPRLPTSSLTHSQRSYVNMLSQFELAKLHHQLADEEVAVASAQNKIADLHSKTEKLVGPGGVAVNGDLVDGPSSQNFLLTYVDQRDGRWSATLKVGGTYKPVHIGTNLPDDYQVIGIDNTGVTLQKDNHRQRVTFNGVVKLPDVLHALAKPSADLPPAQVHKVAKAVQLAHGVMSEQAQLLAMQLVHHGKEAKAVARQGLKIAAPEAALPDQKAAPMHMEARLPATPTLQISIDDQYAREDADEMQDDQLSMDLHLRSLEIKPVVSQPYSTEAYLPQQDNLPQNYNLSMTQLPGHTVYATESIDTSVPASIKPTTAQKRALKLPANQYTIQLIGSYNTDVVNQYILDNELQHKALKLTIGNQRHPWSVALFGVYKTFDQAEAALVHLPHRMRSNGAWIRKIQDVQKVIKRKLA